MGKRNEWQELTATNGGEKSDNAKIVRWLPAFIQNHLRNKYQKTVKNGLMNWDAESMHKTIKEIVRQRSFASPSLGKTKEETLVMEI